jgi:two-component system, cell cycle response regulator DivK
MQIPQAFVGWTVLIADDEVDSLEVASRLIRLAGATVVTAKNGLEALEKVRQHKPHFILSDLSMPEMDGWELVYRLKLERSTLGIPVIALTAHAMSGDRDRAIRAGFHNHISKPLDPAKLVRQLVNVLIDVPELTPMLEAYY